MKKILNLLFLLPLWLQGLAQQLVLPGDHPDPSVTKIGNVYWASATSSNWFPAFPLYQSADLVNWKPSGYIFHKMPEWADYYFWAPEISYDGGKVWVYYTAHKKGGNLCVAVARAEKPEGPYTDLGPLMEQPDGSIDAFPMRDEHGKLYLVWKEDGNSQGLPTPIWAMEMKEDRTGLIGEKKELFRNSEKWEGNLVEGVSMFRHGDYFYALYAANGCCGASCTYGIGVARAKSLLGPWEKYRKNPVETHSKDWVCAGHGTAVQKDGKPLFLYHGYNRNNTVYVGRQGLLNPLRFTDDGWIEFEDVKPSGQDKRKHLITDHFDSPNLSSEWQWSVFKDISYRTGSSGLTLNSLEENSGAYIGQTTYSGNYTAEVSTDSGSKQAEGGLAAIGDDNNSLRISTLAGKIRVVELKGGKERVVASKRLGARSHVRLMMRVTNGKNVNFSYSTNGRTFRKLNSAPLDASYLPPWDRGVRVGLIAKGAPGKNAVFRDFYLETSYE